MKIANWSFVQLENPSHFACEHISTKLIKRRATLCVKFPFTLWISREWKEKWKICVAYRFLCFQHLNSHSVRKLTISIFVVLITVYFTTHRKCRIHSDSFSWLSFYPYRKCLIIWCILSNAETIRRTSISYLISFQTLIRHDFQLTVNFFVSSIISRKSI